MFSKVVRVPDLGNTPAAVNFKTGVMYLSERHIKNMDPDVLRWIILHEKGHYENGNSDEHAADAYAFEQYVKEGRSLKKSVLAFSGVLPMSSPQQIERWSNQMHRALKYDCEINNNQKACNTMNTYTKECQCGGCASYVGEGETLNDVIASYNGCQPGEKPAQCRKRIRVESKAFARENKSEAKRLKQEASAVLADQGIVNKSNAVSDIIGKGLKTVSGILGGGGDSEGSDARMAASEPKNNTMLYVGIGAGVLILLGVVALIISKKK